MSGEFLTHLSLTSVVVRRGKYFTKYFQVSSFWDNVLLLSRNFPSVLGTTCGLYFHVVISVDTSNRNEVSLKYLTRDLMHGTPS